MANAFTFQIKGLKELQNKFNKLPSRIKQEVGEELVSGVRIITQDAKRAAPKNLGALGQSIGFAGSGLSYEISVAVKYGHIIEFGSGKRTQIPSELTTYASQFRGMPSGGKWDDFIKQLKIWVKRKGIGASYSVKSRRKNRQTDQEIEQIAILIARSILKNGIKPQPFLFPAFFRQRPIILNNVKNRLNSLSK